MDNAMIFQAWQQVEQQLRVRALAKHNEAMDLLKTVQYPTDDAFREAMAALAAHDAYIDAASTVHTTARFIACNRLASA